MGLQKTQRRRLLFTGDFRFRGELITEYSYAFSGRQAKAQMMKKISDKHGVSFAAVCGIFDGSKANFEIKVDPEWRRKHG